MKRSLTITLDCKWSSLVPYLYQMVIKINPLYPLSSSSVNFHHTHVRHCLIHEQQQNDFRKELMGQSNNRE
jgi:hypothetical protein